MHVQFHNPTQTQQPLLKGRKTSQPSYASASITTNFGAQKPKTLLSLLAAGLLSLFSCEQPTPPPAGTTGIEITSNFAKDDNKQIMAQYAQSTLHLFESYLGQEGINKQDTITLKQFLRRTGLQSFKAAQESPDNWMLAKDLNNFIYSSGLRNPILNTVPEEDKKTF